MSVFVPHILEGEAQDLNIGGNSSLTQTFYVMDETDRTLARQLLIGYLPILKDNLPLTQVRMGKEASFERGWEAQATWGIGQAIPVEGEVKITIEGEEGRSKITKSLGEVWRGSIPGLVTPPSNNVIGLQSDGTIEGVDLPTSQGVARVEVYRQIDVYTLVYAQRLLDMMNIVNPVKWRGFMEGSLRLRKPYFDSTVKFDSDGEPMGRMVLEFEYQKTELQMTLTVGGLTIGPFDKWGHHYLDLRETTYQHDIPASPPPPATPTTPAKTVVLRRIEHAYVHRVFPELDYRTAFGF